MKTTSCEVSTPPALFSWTGKPPVHGVCPGVTADGAIHSLPQVSLTASRQEFIDYFDNTWTLTEVLFSGLADEEAFYRRPYHKLRHPLIFYFGHPAALYVNKLRLAGLLDGPVHAPFEALFETGVDEMRWDDLHDGEQDVWPPLAEVCAYRRNIYNLIRQLIETHPLLEFGKASTTLKSPVWALAMGFEHERIHLETSSVLMRELPVECVRRPQAWPALPTAKASPSARPRRNLDYPDNRLLAVVAREVFLGKPWDWPSFGWDNEYGSEMRRLEPFSASEFLVSNGEFHDFVAGGGYHEERFWSAEGWAWRCFRNTKWPTFWVPDGPAGLHQYKLRTIFEIVDMPWDQPVCVNFHEAKAYCAWRESRNGKACRLLSEAEHHALRDGRDRAYNLHLSTGGESPVNAGPVNGKGFYDVFGNVWQWCEDHFHPLTGFRIHPYYDDFSRPCFDGEHQMILGGSFISTGDEASPFARFHFRPHFFQHAGFRVVEAERCDARRIRSESGSPYETKENLNRYLLMHWGVESEMFDANIQQQVPPPAVVQLPVRCAELAGRFAENFDQALDLGCAVGRAAFEMARRFRCVMGIDASQKFIQAAQTLQRDGRLVYCRKDEGAAATMLAARVDAAVDRSRVSFDLGDACTLSAQLHSFDAVLLANVLCRVPDPAAVLARMAGENGLVAPGGVLILTTPFSWLPQYTPENRWLRGVAGVQRHLTEFDLIHQEEMPFLIREHRRKFDYIIACATVWRRKKH